MAATSISSRRATRASGTVLTVDRSGNAEDEQRGPVLGTADHRDRGFGCLGAGQGAFTGGRGDTIGIEDHDHRTIPQSGVAREH